LESILRDPAVMCTEQETEELIENRLCSLRPCAETMSLVLCVVLPGFPLEHPFLLVKDYPMEIIDDTVVRSIANRRISDRREAYAHS